MDHIASFMTAKKIKSNRGMTLLELVVVLGIFSVMSSITLFNYKDFQAKIDIKNLANDIALKVIEAQNFSLAGKWDANASVNWKPSYGLYFNISAPTKFIYFADLNNSGVCDGAGCSPPYSLSGEVRDIVNITNGNSIPVSGLEAVGGGCSSAPRNNLTLVFKRPNSSPSISSFPGLGCTPDNIIINISSPTGITSKVKLYSSGRVQIN